jgi:CubicO group peptidase (beta-lactamase class C family)
MIRVTALLLLAATMVTEGREPVSDRPAGPWQQYANIGDAGFDPAAIAAARTFAEQSGTASAILIQHGRVVFAWGDPAHRFRTASIRKSLLSLMFGSPQINARVNVKQTLADLGIDDREALSVRERSATVDHLLSARSGIYHPAAFEPASMTATRPARGSAAPGESWFYNNWDFNALSTIYERQAGMDVFTGFQSTIATPIGLEDFRPLDGVFVREPGKSRHPAYEFRLSARDLARVGQLVLQDGRWQGKEVVSSKWLADSLRIRSPFPAGGGYAYLWWIDASGFRASDFKLPAIDAVHDIAATGLGEQLLLIVPSLDLVFVHLTYGEGPRVVDSAGYRLADMLLQGRRGPPKIGAPTTSVTPQRFASETTTEWLERVAVPMTGAVQSYIGKYEVAPNIRATIAYLDNILVIDMPGRGEAELFPLAPDTFFLKVADVVLTFERDGAGTVQGVRVVERGREMRGKKVE